MIDKFPRWPRSNYPDFNSKKFDYSRDENIASYIETAKQLGVDISGFNSNTLTSVEIKSLVDKICLSKTIHEATVYSDILWDAYNSYEHILDAIRSQLLDAGQKNQDKMILLVRYLKMDIGLNRRSIDGKHYSEIEKDALFYRNISIIAKDIIKQVLNK